MEGNVEDEIRLLKCVGNEIRYKILKLLENEEKCVSDIMAELEEEQSLVSHHLKALLKCKLISRRREGRNIIYSLSTPEIPEFLEEIRKLSVDTC